MTETVDPVDVHGWQQVIDALPPLSAEERQGLAAGIAEHGVLVPVYILPDGRIIDGHHRWELSGGMVETRTLDLPEDEAFRLALSLNVDRRQMTPETSREKRQRMKETAHTLREGGMTQKETANVLGVDRSTVSRLEDDQSVNNVQLHNSDHRPDFRRKIPDDQHLIIMARIEAGEKHAAVAADYGVTKGAITSIRKRVNARRACEALGLPPPKSGKARAFTNEQEHEIELRYRVGADLSTLATTYGVAKSTIHLAIKRVRAYRDEHGIAPPPIPPELIITSTPSNVVDIHGRRPPREAFPKREVKPEVIRHQVLEWWTRWGKRSWDEFCDLQSRCGDALAPALRVGVEGEILREGLTQAAAAYGAAAESIRRGNAGQEDRGHGSTGS